MNKICRYLGGGMKSRFNYAFGVTLLLVFLTACSVHRQSVAPVEAVSKETTTIDEAFKITNKNEVALLLEQQNYFSALSTIHQRVENGQAESSLSSEYLQALQGVLQRAEELMAEGVLDEAASNFQAALECIPQEADLASKAPLSAANIKAKIDNCADQLMEDGLLAYRAGNLETAIGIWGKILTFQPQHEASQKAIHTASLQLTNLKTLEQKE